LAQTQRELIKNPSYIPPPAVMDVHKYVIDRAEGKAAVKVDVSASVQVKHDPSLMIAALKELQTTESAWRLVDIKPIEAPEREPSDPTREVSHDPVSEVDITE
jgi:hypothetical protein